MAPLVGRMRDMSNFFAALAAIGRLSYCEARYERRPIAPGSYPRATSRQQLRLSGRY